MSVDEAIELADLLLLRANAATAGLVAKIRERARRDPFRGGSVSVALERDEAQMLLEALTEVLREPGWAETAPAYVHLRRELVRHLAG